MDLGLTGARVFVAASSAGLGAAVARRFCLEGAHVALNGRAPTRLAATAQQLRAETGGTVLEIAGDVSQADQVYGMVAQAAEQLGGLDILVTNAGGPPAGTFATVEPADYELAFRLNFMSAVHLIRAALPHLRRSQHAAILTITSVTVKQPVNNLILSNSVRMAVAGLTKSLASELGPQGIRVNSILPGYTRTERVQQLMEKRAQTEGITLEEAYARQATVSPLGRLGEPDEFANVAVFLCSPAAGYVHGAMIPVDGGMIAATL
ncbi:MAG: SDR family oxidoreductase, partial [Aggregatilineaceae bacterium]